MALPALPPPVEISVETKKQVIEGLKRVIEVFKAKGLIDKGLTYQAIINEPGNLQAFLGAYKKNAALADKLVVSQDGKPVRDAETPLVCGISLGQIQQLLVKTCAKKVFDKDKVEAEPVIETITTRRFLFFTKTETIEKRPTVTADDRKLRELLNYMAFDWQLPLLPVYKEALNYQQLAELGADVVALQSEASIRSLARFDAATLKKAKAVAGNDFANLLANRPAAIPGVIVWSRDMYGFFRGALQDKAWEFFAREKSFFNVVAELDKPTARVYGDVLCYAAGENLQELQRLNIDKAGVLIEALKSSLGENCRPALTNPAFSKDFLRKLVESLLHMTQEKDQMQVSATLTVKAIAPQVADWLAKQKAA